MTSPTTDMGRECAKCGHPLDEHINQMCRHVDGVLHCKCYREVVDAR